MKKIIVLLISIILFSSISSASLFTGNLNKLITGKVVSCNGCLYKNQCYSLGDRVEGRFCDIDKNMKLQKSNGAECDNDFECKSSFCSYSTCSSLYSDIQTGLNEASSIDTSSSQQNTQSSSTTGGSGASSSTVGDNSSNATGGAGTNTASGGSASSGDSSSSASSSSGSSSGGSSSGGGGGGGSSGGSSSSGFNRGKWRDYVIPNESIFDQNTPIYQQPSDTNNVDYHTENYNLCNSNSICESGENYGNCAQDCSSGGNDDYCDGIEDNICDLDCSSDFDTDIDCESSNFYLIIVSVIILITGGSIFLYFKKRKQNISKTDNKIPVPTKVNTNIPRN